MSDLRDQARRHLSRGRHRRTTTPLVAAATGMTSTNTLAEPGLFDIGVADVDGSPTTVSAEPAVDNGDGGGSREDQQP